MMVAWTELGLPSGVWYFSRETLHNSSAIKSERNASLFLRSKTSCAPRGKIQMRFYFILCRYAWSIQNKTPRSQHAIDNHKDHTNHWGGGSTLVILLKRGFEYLLMTFIYLIIHRLFFSLNPCDVAISGKLLENPPRKILKSKLEGAKQQQGWKILLILYPGMIINHLKCLLIMSFVAEV